uniref:Uncharacterized protein n=1 Tax=Ceratitis capitata TaxID=7213 RepID=W8BB96_CERCA
MSSHSVVSLSSFNILFFTQVLTVLTSSIKYQEYVTDKGKNISIPCTAEGNVMWVKENGNNSTIIQTGKFLMFTNISADEGGLYVCFAAIPSRQFSAPKTDSIAQTTINTTTSGQRKSISTSSASLPTTSTATSSSTSSVSTSLAEDTKIATIIIVNATTTTKASTTSSLSMPMPTIAVAIDRATATNANRKTNTTNTSIVEHEEASIADKANGTTIISSTFDNGDQTIRAVPVEFIESLTPERRRNTTDKILTVVQQHHEEDGDGEEEEVTDSEEYRAVEKVNLTVRTPPGPVTQLYFKASTILGFLIWRFNKTFSGGYPVRSFTAEFRNISYSEMPYNKSFEHEWSRMDPINIAPNVRQMEVYRLEPNTTYEFRIWANNQLGSGEVVTTNVTTLPETKEEDLIRLIQPDLDNFDPRIWIIAVSVVLGTLVILAIGLCIVLSKECYQSSQSGIDHNTDNTNTITSNTNYTNNTNNTTTTTATSATLATRNNADVERNLNVVVMA